MTAVAMSSHTRREREREKEREMRDAREDGRVVCMLSSAIIRMPHAHGDTRTQRYPSLFEYFRKPRLAYGTAVEW